MKKLLLSLVIAAVSSACNHVYWPISDVPTEVKISTRTPLKKGSILWLGEEKAESSMLIVTQKDIEKAGKVATIHFPESMRGKRFFVRVYESLPEKEAMGYVRPKGQGSFTVGTNLALVLDGDDSYAIHLSRLFGCLGEPYVGFSLESQKVPKD